MRLDSWRAIEAEIDRITEESGAEESGAEDQLNQNTKENVRDFVNFARERCPVPTEVGRGYRATIRFSWSTRPPVEVEVFEDRFEFYRFYDGRTEIKEARHTPGGAFPQELAADLPSAG